MGFFGGGGGWQMKTVDMMDQMFWSLKTYIEEDGY